MAVTSKKKAKKRTTKKAVKKTTATKKAVKKAKVSKAPASKAGKKTSTPAKKTASKAGSKKSSEEENHQGDRRQDDQKGRQKTQGKSTRSASAKKTAASSTRAKANARAMMTSGSDELIHGIAPYRATSRETYMNQKQLDHFRSILTAWRRELVEEVNRTIHTMQDETVNHPDPNDRATQESDMSLELRSRDRERKIDQKDRWHHRPDRRR